jgi:TPP-dependent pyruvate/acetoin dehydrogenase alpha subunit
MHEGDAQRRARGRGISTHDVALSSMKGAGIEVSREELEKLEAEVAHEVEEAVRFAEESPDPEPESICEDVYASPDDPALLRDI